MKPKPLDDLLFDSKEFSFMTGHTFRGVTLSAKGSGWNIVLRAYTAANDPVYAMTQHDDPREGLQILLGALATRGGPSLWHHDKYYKPSG